MSQLADVVVVGLGAVGSAALYRLAQCGVRAVGIDRFHPPHHLGSTHGESRITRLAIAEGAAYLPFVHRLRLAQQAGAEVRVNERVLAIEPCGSNSRNLLLGASTNPPHLAEYPDDRCR